MGWNPFAKPEPVKPAQVEEKKKKPPPSRLPEYDDRGDTRRIVTTLADYRASKEEGNEELEETAASMGAEAAATAHTMRSMPAFRIPMLAALVEKERSK